jgi:hypothetical protein
MRQMAMVLDEDETPWALLRLTIDNAVHYLGVKDVVYKLNAAKSTVSDALGDKNDRHWRQEWTLVVLEMLADRYEDTANQFAKSILDAQAAITRRFEVVSMDDAMTDDEVATLERLTAKAKKQKRTVRGVR